MSDEQKSQDQQQDQQQGQQAQQDQQAVQPGSEQHTPPDFDGLQDKKPEELTPEELRLMADTMPGEGPGD